MWARMWARETGRGVHRKAVLEPPGMVTLGEKGRDGVVGTRTNKLPGNGLSTGEGVVSR